MRLIDADALLAKGFPTVYHTEFCTPVIDVADIERMPTIDAVLVVHGEWIFKKPPDDWVLSLYECSVCHHMEEGQPNYCPNCGAKMKGENDEQIH